MAKLEPRRFEFLSIGRLSFDIHVSPGGERSEPEPGGAAAFTALTARKLGLQPVLAHVRVGLEYPARKLLREIHAQINITTHPTIVFEDRIEKGQRQQRLLVPPVAADAEEPALIRGWFAPRLLMACPLLDELPLDCREWFEAEFSCLIAQGWFRQVGRGRVIKHRAPDVEQIAGRWDVIVLSEQEAAVVRDLDRWRRACRMLVVTRGERGALVMEGASEVAIPAVAARQVVDTTGAGDVWAAAFTVRYTETGSVAEAGRFAAAAAAVCVSRKGLRGVPKSREEVESLL